MAMEPMAATTTRNRNGLVILDPPSGASPSVAESCGPTLRIGRACHINRGPCRKGPFPCEGRNLHSGASMHSPPRVAIVGATGLVGRELLALLEQRDFPLASLRLLASSRSARERLRFAGRDVVVEALADDSLAGVDVA